ncbi:hypothetical protein [Desulfomicrobium salsuginis]
MQNLELQSETQKLRAGDVDIDPITQSLLAATAGNTAGSTISTLSDYELMTADWTELIINRVVRKMNINKFCALTTNKIC